MTYLLTENDWENILTREGWEVTRIDKSTWGPVLQAATNTNYRSFAHFPDLVLAQRDTVVFVDCAGGRHGYDAVPARHDKVIAHRNLSEQFNIPVIHAWATGHIAPISTILEHGQLGKKNPNGYRGDGEAFLLVPIDRLDLHPVGHQVILEHSGAAA